MARTWLKDKRTEFGLSQKAVAKLAEITPAYYSYIENGDRRPSVIVAQKIAAVLGFPNEWYKLLENTEIKAESVAL